MNEYTLPAPVGYSGLVPYYSADQVQQAFKDGAASRDSEVEALRADALRWVWWTAAISRQDMDLLEATFRPIPHDKPCSKTELDAAIDAAISAEATK